MGRKWKPSRSKAREFAQEMAAINEFCAENNITASHNNDSYYFTINGQAYRVSNHSVEASNRGAYDRITGEKVREFYHQDGRKENVVYIHASKTRIEQIYNDLKAGYELDGRGNRK